LLNIGDTFLLPSPGCATEHLWIVVTVPDAKRSAICVNVTSSDPDRTTELSAGDHPFIKHPSVVRYRDARQLNLTPLENVLSGRASSGRLVCRLQPCCSEALLNRIQAGLLQSLSTPKGIKAHCATAWGIEWPPRNPDAGETAPENPTKARGEVTIPSS
jgi:hypothetical protein